MFGRSRATFPASVGLVLEDFGLFCRHFGIGLYPWQAEQFGAATARIDGRFKFRLAGLSVARGQGKSFGGAAVGLWRLLAGPPPQDIISAALDRDGAGVVLAHARRLIRGHAELASAITVQAGALTVKATGSKWTVTSRDHTSSRGRHATLVIYDEMGWAADDELFSSLLAGQASVSDPLMLVISTVGRRRTGPLWTVKTLAEGGDESVYWWWSGDNLSPRVTAAFLERQKRILLPTQYAREHENRWIDAADSFTSAVDVDAAMGHAWSERAAGTPGQTAVCFVDIGAIHDPTAIAVGHAEGEHSYIDRLITFQGSREAPVSLAAVEATLIDLARRFALSKIRIESWQGLSAVQSLQRHGLPVELFTPTAKAHSEEWPVLAQALAAGALILPQHARLREELLNLVYEVGPQGVRVSDRGAIHQDHAVAVRGVVAMLKRPPRREWRWLGSDDSERPRVEESFDQFEARVAAEDAQQRQDAADAMREHLRQHGWYFPGDPL